MFSRRLVAVLFLAAAPAFAQEGGFGLDLTEDTKAPAPAPEAKEKKPRKKKKRAEAPPPADGLQAPAAESPAESPAEPAAAAPAAPEPAADANPAANLGLDLSTDTVDRRPPLAFIGVTAPAEDLELASWLEGGLSGVAQKLGSFKAVLSAADVRDRMGEGYQALVKCGEAQCLEDAGEALEAERLLRVELLRDGDSAKARIVTFARGEASAQSREVPISRMKKNDVLKALSGPYKEALAALGTTLAELKVTANVPAVVTLGRRTLGMAPRDDMVPAGKQPLEVSADGFLADKRELSLSPGQVEEVSVRLAAVQLARDLPDEPVKKKAPGPMLSGIWTRPGLYVAAAGLVAAGVGLAFGASAMGIQARATDANGDGILDITRAEALSARNSALAADLLVGAGAAMAVGGGIWFFITPQPAQKGGIVGARGSF